MQLKISVNGEFPVCITSLIAAPVEAICLPDTIDPLRIVRAVCHEGKVRVTQVLASLACCCTRPTSAGACICDWNDTLRTRAKVDRTSPDVDASGSPRR